MKLHMPHRLGIQFGVTTAILLFAATTASALDADELWQAWQDNRETSGYQVASDGVSRSGNTVTHRNIVITGQATAQADEMIAANHTRIDIAEMTLEELSDGTVRMTVSPEITATSETTPEDSEPVSVDLKLVQEGLTTIVSGTPDALSYAFDAPKMTLSLVNAETNAPETQTTPIAMQMVMENTKGDMKVAIDGETQTQTTAMSIAQIDITADGTDDETGANYQFTTNILDITSNSNSNAPTGVTDLDVALSNGSSYTFDGKTGPIKASFTQSGGASPAHLVLSAGGSKTAGALTEAGLSHTAQIDDQRVELLQSPDPSIPVPISFDIARMNTEFAIPLVRSDAPQPYVAKIGLSDVEASETLWGIIDPTRTLPRDPAQLSLDIDGTVRIMTNLFAPQTAPIEGSLIEFDTVRLNKMELSVAGMKLDGSGSATFDTTSGVPVPVGTVDLKLVGANGLMKNLVDIGLIEQQQTLIAQMMLGLYAVRAGDDSYTSLIEMKPSGAILANGQQIR